MAQKKQYAGQIPVNTLTGDMYDYTSAWTKDVEMIDNPIFASEMVLDSWQRGRSAVRVWLKEVPSQSNGQKSRKFPMFMKDFWELVTEHGVTHGKTPMLQWTGCKRGANYGIRVYP